MTYVIVGVVCWVFGFLVAARSKENITIGFGNQIINQTKEEEKK
jgi:hypothetical protein